MDSFIHDFKSFLLPSLWSIGKFHLFILLRHKCVSSTTIVICPLLMLKYVPTHQQTV